MQWRCRRAAGAVHPAAVASPAQVRAILDQVHCTRPDLTTFFGCLYFAALRPEEAVALRRDDLVLPARSRATIIVSAACPRTGTAWTSTGTPHQARGLKHRPDGAIRVVPLPAALARSAARPSLRVTMLVKFIHLARRSLGCRVGRSRDPVRATEGLPGRCGMSRRELDSSAVVGVYEAGLAGVSDSSE